VKLNRTVLAIALALGACASEPTSISYYMLTTPSSEPVTRQAALPKPSLVIEELELAAYLRQSGIALQTGSNKLQVSRQHLWAENLELAVPKLLLQELQRQSNDFNFYIRNIDFVPQTDYRLRLHIDNLQATEQGEVLSSGRYQLISNATPAESHTTDFFFTEDLLDDGYEHAVEKMRVLIKDIAEDVLVSASVFITQ
jgi:uncharacterized lipoprotein YmbA